MTWSTSPDISGGLWAFPMMVRPGAVVTGPGSVTGGGMDQLDEIRRLLNADLESRRAVAVLFDPAKGFTETLDVPCNNWLHFLVRHGRLKVRYLLSGYGSCTSSRA